MNEDSYLSQGWEMVATKTITADNYKQIDAWQLVESAAAVLDRCLLYGPPALGKTYLALHAGEPDPVYPVAIHSDLPAAELRGHWIPGADGRFEWQDGPAISAWRGGGRLILNEVDQLSDDAMSFALPMLDNRESAKIVLGTTGQVIEPHEDFTVWATMNGVPEDLPEALVSRFPVRIPVLDPNPAAILALDADLRPLAKSLATHADPERKIDLRQLFEFQRMRRLIDHEHAAILVFQVRAQEVLDSLAAGSVVSVR